MIYLVRASLVSPTHAARVISCKMFEQALDDIPHFRQRQSVDNPMSRFISGGPASIDIKLATALRKCSLDRCAS